MSRIANLGVKSRIYSTPGPFNDQNKIRMGLNNLPNAPKMAPALPKGTATAKQK